MPDEMTPQPDSTAVRVALWRAMHVQVDPPPHVIEDEIGLRLAAPDEGWRSRPDMHPQWTSAFRASIVARARFVEDLVVERAAARRRPVRDPRRGAGHVRAAAAGDRVAHAASSRSTSPDRRPGSGSA